MPILPFSSPSLLSLSPLPPSSSPLLISSSRLQLIVQGFLMMPLRRSLSHLSLSFPFSTTHHNPYPPPLIHLLKSLMVLGIYFQPFIPTSGSNKLQRETGKHDQRPTVWRNYTGTNSSVWCMRKKLTRIAMKLLIWHYIACFFCSPSGPYTGGGPGGPCPPPKSEVRILHKGGPL